MEVPEGMTNDGEAALVAIDQLPLLLYGFEGPDMRCMMLNSSVRAMLGQRVMGWPIEEALSQMMGQQLFERIREVYSTGVAFVGDEWRLDIPDPAGQPREYFITFIFSPWRDPDGTVRGVSGFAHDVTDVVQARRAAAEAETAGLRRQYEQARQTVTALQDALLPSELPMLPGVDLSARYLLAETNTAAGGDWFDTVVLDDGRVALVVGDVVGHGVHASAAMGQLRSALATLLQNNPDPAEAITRLEKFARRIPGAAATTVCVAVLDPATGELTYCTAGRAFTVNVAPRPADRLTDQVMELLTRITGHRDDITLFAAHRRAPIEAFTRTGPAVADVVARWRAEFNAWLRALVPQAVVAIGVQHAVLELTSNAVEHAYAGSAPGELTLTATLTPIGNLEITVRDHGRWKDVAPSAADRGRGLALTGAMVDELSIDGTATGTTATVRTALTQATSMVARASRPYTEPAEYSHQLDGSRLAVSGPIDISTAREFDGSLREAARHATTPLTVDLSDVTHLASAGIQVLAEALRRSDSRLTLFARPGTPAQHVLALTQLPHFSESQDPDPAPLD